MRPRAGLPTVSKRDPTKEGAPTTATKTQPATTEATSLANPQREQAGIAGRFQDAANRGDGASLIDLKARAGVLPDLILAAQRRDAERAVADAEAAIAGAEAERKEAYAALDAANEALEAAAAERTRLALAAEDARYAVKDATTRRHRAVEALAALTPLRHGSNGNG